MIFQTLYYFVEPPVMPFTKNFLNIIASKAGGNIAKSPAAVVMPYCMLSFDTNSDATIDIGFVAIELAKIRGIWNCPQDIKNTNKKADKIIGVDIGIIILNNTSISLHPSI